MPKAMKNIEQLKTIHKKDLDMYSENIREHIDKYGSGDCDYLIHRRLMKSYHQGAVNVLNSLEKAMLRE